MASSSHSDNGHIWRIELLGGLVARSGDAQIDRFPTRMTAGLLALLAYAPGKRHTREEIIDILWPEADLDSGRDRLSQALSWLRRQLEPGVQRGSVLHADRLTVAVNPEHVTTDVAEFLAGASADGLTEGLAAAVDLYRGELLQGHYADWVLSERRRLHEVYLHALHLLTERYRETADYDRALDYARRAVAADSLREEGHIDLIRLLTLTGNQAAALRQYREMEHILAAELGIEPGEAIKDLLAGMQQAERVAMSPAPQHRAPMPVPLTRLFGREREIEQIRQRVLSGEPRLISLLGVGGVGKTRLALAAAVSIAESMTGPVAFVPLADIDDAAMAPAAILAAMRVARSAGESITDQIVRLFAAGAGLLILDNAEHLVNGLAALVRELLQRAPRLTALVTTRQRLGVEGEHEISVTPLEVPARAAPARSLLANPTVQLFVDRACAVRPGFAVTEANAGAIAQLCERLEGLPLAVELCAAWAQTLTPAQMLEKLSRRFDLLVSRRADITPRHRTLRAALEYSYLQLPADLQRLYTGLAVFRGGWDLEAAGICLPESGHEAMDALMALTELRERSLIVAEEPAGAGAMRYRMLETLREFASEQMSYAERAELRRRHATFYLALAQDAGTAIAGPEEEAHLLLLDSEMENLRVALAWCVEAEETETGLRISSALGRYWSIRGYLDEGLEWLQRLLNAQEARDVSPAVRATALGMRGHLAWLRGDYTMAQASHTEALHIRTALSDSAGQAESLYYLGITAYRQENYAGARDLLERSLAIATERRDPAGISRVLLNLGNLAYEARDYDGAAGFLAQSLEIEQQQGNRRRIADVMNNLGLVDAARGEYASAADQFRRSLAIKRELKDHYGTAVALANLGGALRRQDNHEQALALLTEGLALAHRIGNRHILTFYLFHLALLAASDGDPARATYLLAASAREQRELGSTFNSPEVEEYDGTLQALRERLGDARFDRIATDGEADPLATVISVALKETQTWKD